MFSSIHISPQYSGIKPELKTFELLGWVKTDPKSLKVFSLNSKNYDQINKLFCFSDLFPFAVDASVFREQYQARVAVVKSELVRYLVCNKGMVSDQDEAADKV